MKKVLWLTNIPSPYRVAFFNELGKKCELTVLFEKAFSDERNDQWKTYNYSHFKGLVLPSKSIDVDKAFSCSMIKYINQYKNDIIIVSNPATPTGILSIFFMILFKIPYIIESDGAFPKAPRGIKGFVKCVMYSRAKACFTTSELGKEYFILNHVKKEDIYLYPFTSVSRSDIPDCLSKEQRREIRYELKMEEEFIVISVGRFIESKGFDILLEAARLINDKSIGVYIVGDKPTNGFLAFCQVNELCNVHFVDFMPSEELKKWYLSADLFVLPTRTDVWGLVINEAMSCGLPVITTTMCVAGTEMINHKNGKLIEIDNPELLALSIKEILSRKDICQMGINSREVASKYTIEEMSERHIYLFNLLY